MRGASAASLLVVADASLVVKWLVREAGSEEALALLRPSIHWVAPHLVLTETAGALRRKAAGSEITRQGAEDALAELVRMVRTNVIGLVADDEAMALALSMALGGELRLPDCLYLAVAVQRGAGLATGDARLAAAARERRLRTMVVGNG